MSDTDRSIHPALGASDSIDVDELRQTVKENIDYDILLQDHRYDRDRLDEIVDLIVETLCSTKPTICVSGDDFPAALFNAPSTINSYYSALVNHDLYDDGSRGR